MKKLLFVTLALLVSCASSDDTKDVVGILKSTSSKVVIPASSPPGITVSGRNMQEFGPPEYSTADLNSPLVHFILRGIPDKQPVVFRVAGTSVDPIVTFPLDITKLTTVTLPAVEPNTKVTIINEIKALGTSVDETAGMIIGQIDTTGLNCASIKSVAIRSKETGQPVSVGGPFYFDRFGHLINGQMMQDAECSYVIANVLPGNYLLDFLDSTINIVSTYEIIALAGQLTFGMDVH